MNHTTLLFLSIALTPITLFGNNDSVMVTTIQNNQSVDISMDLEINGTIKLYSISKEDADEETEALQPASDVAFLNWVLDPDKDFYIGIGEDVELITPTNYKRLIKKYFQATPELIKRVGKRGFRYKNLPSMIIFYNKRMAKEGGLIKSDLICKS